MRFSKLEPSIRTVAHTYTSHILVLNEDGKTTFFAESVLIRILSGVQDFVTTRILIQSISNIITSNEALLQQLWDTYMGLSEEKSILMHVQR